MNQSQETKWVHASQSSTWETKVEGLILVWGQSVLYGEYQVSQAFIIDPVYKGG